VLVPVAWTPDADRGVVTGRRDPAAARVFCLVSGWIGTGRMEAALSEAGNVEFRWHAPGAIDRAPRFFRGRQARPEVWGPRPCGM
jgi:hypothetical protein